MSENDNDKDKQGNNSEPGNNGDASNGAGDQTDSQTGETGNGKGFDFIAWLESQTDEVKSGYAQTTSGLKSALDKERATRKALERDAKRADDERKRLDEQALIDNEKWQELAKQREQSITDLSASAAELTATNETLTAQNERYSAAIEKMTSEMAKGLPRHVVTLLSKLDTLEQFEYLIENAETLKLKGIPPTPKADDTRLTAEEKRKRAYSVRSL